MARPGRLTELTARVTALVDLPQGPRVVALSGGADSAACAWAAGEEARAIHVHHGLAHSDPMAEAAEAVAGRLGLPLEVVEVSVPAGPSPEAQARTVRYRVLFDTLRTGEWLLTGHTADDQAETVLINLLRGSGLDGLAGMPARRPPLARPLLEVDRSTTRELATLLGLPWRDDPANDDLSLLRNRIRRRLLPELEAGYAAGLRRALVRSARVVAAEVEVLEDLAGRVPVEVRAGGARLPVGAVLAVEQAVAARALRRAIGRLRPPYPPSAAAVDTALQVARGERPGGDLGGGVTARRTGPWVELAAAGAPAEPPPPVTVPVPGTAVWGRFTIEVGVSERPPPVPLSAWAMVRPIDPVPTVRLRATRPEDRIPLLSGSKRVFDALSEAGIPADERAGWPVVEIDGRLLWVPGVRRSGARAEGGSRYLCALVSEEVVWERSEP